MTRRSGVWCAWTSQHGGKGCSGARAADDVALLLRRRRRSECSAAANGETSRLGGCHPLGVLAASDAGVMAAR